MKRTVLICVVVVAIATLVVAASAQPIYKPNIIKIGGNWPTNGDVRDATDSVWFYAGYERIVAELPGSNSDITVEAGWAKGSGETAPAVIETGTVGLAQLDEGGPVDVRVIPLVVNWRQHSAADTGNSSFFYGVGAGAYFVKTDVDGDSDSKTKFGVAPLIGIEGDNWQAELKYNIIGKVHGERLDSLMLTAGFRF